MSNYFIQDVALAKGLARLRADLQVAGLITNYTREAVDQGSKFAQSVSVPIYGTNTAKDKVAGVNATTESANSSRGLITINKFKTVDIEVPDAEALFTKDGYLADLLMNGADALAEAIEADVLGCYVDASRVIGSPKGGASVSLIRTIKKHSRTDKWRQMQPKFVVWGAEGEDDLLSESLFVQANERGDNVGVVNGTIDKKFGFNHIVSNLAPSIAGSPGAEHALAFQKEGIGIAFVPMDNADLPAEVKSAMGVYMRSMILNDDNGNPAYSMRFMVGYSQLAKATILTVDTMYGVKVVRPELVYDVLV